MRLPLSLHLRIALVSAVMVAATLAINISEVGGVVEGVVADNIDVQLDTQIRILGLSIDQSGLLDSAGLRHFPGLLRPVAGWGWLVDAGQRRWSQGTDLGLVLYPVPHVHEENGIYSGLGTAASGEAIHIRRLDLQKAGHRLSIIMVSPRRLIDREVNRVQNQMYKISAEVFGVLVLAAIFQLRVGLQPLRQLVRHVARVRAGEARSVPARQPTDLQPLAHEINALIERNQASIDMARVNAANLAHSVKTPLSTLMLQLEHEGASEETRGLLRDVSERVSHHLRRARSSAISANQPLRADVAEIARSLITTMTQRGHSLGSHASHIAFSCDISAPCHVAAYEDDLREMLGNLVENASRFARSRVMVGVQDRGAMIAIHVDDDGPGIPDSEIPAAMRPGVRLDEAGEGYGLGLAIVFEMAGFHGGILTLAASPVLAGLRAALELPRT